MPWQARRILILLAPFLWAACAPSSAPPPRDGYRTITIDPKRDSEAAARFNSQGVEFLAKDQLGPAADAFTKALDVDVEFGPAHNNLGKVYYKQKDWYKAAWEFEYASKLLPRHAEPRNNLGLVLEESGQLDKAVEQYRQAIALSSDIQYRANLARCLLRRDGRTDEVRTLLQQVLEQDSRPDWRNWARREMSLGKQ